MKKQGTTKKVLIESILGIFISIFLLAGISYATEWSETYGGAGNDNAYSVQQTEDGGYIVAGHTTSFGAVAEDAWIIKLDGNGNIVWQRTYGGGGDDRVVSVQQTADGGYIASGYTTSFGAAGKDIWILKLSSTGTVSWQERFGGANDEEAASVQQTVDGYIVAGHTTSFSVVGEDIWILKLSSTGTISWQKTYGGAGDDYATSIQQTLDGGYIVAGHTTSFSVVGEDIWILKLSSTGTISWQKTYGGAGDDYATSMRQAQGGYTVAGYTNSSGAGGVDELILRLDSNGNIVWQNTYGGSGDDYATSMRQTLDGGYIVAGHTTSFGAAGTDAWVLKLDGDGSIAWQNTYAGSGNDIAESVRQTSDDGYVVAGHTTSFGVAGTDAWVLKLDGDGNIPSCPLIDPTTVIPALPVISTVNSSATGPATAATVTVTSATVQSSIVATTTVQCINITYDLTVSKTGTGSGTVTSSPAGINCGSDCAETYSSGTAVVLTAAAAANSVFAGWSGGGCSGTGTCAVTMNADTAVTATFTNVQHTLTVSKAGTGSGSVTSNPAGINCGSDCSETYDAGTVVTLTAAAEPNSVFAGWSGGGCSGTGTCAITMTSAAAVTATFTRSHYVLTVSTMGNGTGTVTSSPAGIDCGSDCSDTYNSGTSVTLTAAAAVNSVFAGWSGGGCSGTGTCAITANADTAVTATFTRSHYALAVSKAGTGSGKVTSPGLKISCEPDCTETFTPGSTVTLTAKADLGSVFEGWSGGGCSGTDTCMLTMNADITVTATFTKLNQFILDVNIIPGGGVGIITGGGINCPGSLCATTYDPGTPITLTVAEITDYAVFSHWEGCDSSLGKICNVVMDSDKEVMAFFEFKTFWVAPDLTGEWLSIVGTRCKETTKGLKCSAKGYLAVNNIGPVDTRKSTSVRFYLSNDKILDARDLFLKSLATGKVKKDKRKVKTFSHNFALDQDISGKYIITFIDEFNNIDEIDESNNTIVYGPLP